MSESSGGTNTDDEKDTFVSIKHIIKWLSQFVEENLEFDCSENDFITFVDKKQGLY